MAKREILVPEGLEYQYENWHLAPAVKYGNLIHCSGQLGIDKRGKLSSDPEQQIDAAFKNLEMLLSGIGCRWSDLVDLTSYHVDIRNTLAVFGQVKASYITESFCAQTAIGVEALGVDGAIVELKAIVAG